PQRAAFRVTVALRIQLQLVPDRSVAGMRVEVGAEVRGQVERDAAVAGGHRPVVLHRGPGRGAEGDRAVAGVELHRVELAADADAAVAGIDAQVPGHVFERDRAV